MVFPDNGVDVHRAGGITRPRYMLCHYERRREAVEKLLEREYGLRSRDHGNGLRLEPLHVLGFASARLEARQFPSSETLPAFSGFKTMRNAKYDFLAHPLFSHLGNRDKTTD